MESEYKSKKTGELKTTKRTETVQKEESIAELVDEFIDMWNDYLVHRYQIENDKFQWSKIFDTDQQYGTIHHLDFSENLQFAPKFEPQSDQYTLHCTVAHSFDEDAFNKYIYHFSNDTSHVSQFSYAIVDDLMANNDQCLIFHFNSDNCSQLYKSCFVFANCKAVAKN